MIQYKKFINSQLNWFSQLISLPSKLKRVKRKMNYYGGGGGGSSVIIVGDSVGFYGTSFANMCVIYSQH